MRIDKRVFLTATLFAAAAGPHLPGQGRGPVPGDHMKVPPATDPSIYMSAAEIRAGLDKIDPKLIASQTGGAVNVGQGMNIVVRRRVSGPQYAIIHMTGLEYVIVTKGSGTMVTGGALIPPTIDTDIYPGTATVRSAKGVNGGLGRKIGPGDVIVTPPGTPHWLSGIDGSIEYVEIRIEK